MVKIKFFGGWAPDSDVVLDYIDPKRLLGVAWQLFGYSPTHRHMPIGDT
jgi:hypothetical protein